MFPFRSLIVLAILLGLIPGEALAYGVILKSPGGISMDNRMQDYEAQVLTKVAEVGTGLGVPPESKFELVIGADGKPQGASFISTTADDATVKSFVEKVKGQAFGPVPSVEGEGTLTLTFTFLEAKTPPFNRNSIQISGGGGARINGGGLIVTGPGGSDPRQFARSFATQRQALDAQKPTTAKEKEENVRANLRLIRTALGPKYQVDAIPDPSKPASAPSPEDQANVRKCFAAAVKTLDTMDAESQGHLITDFVTLASRLVRSNMPDIADSAIRKAIDIESVSNKGANQFSPRIIDNAASRVADLYRARNQNAKGIALVQYRIDKFKAASINDPLALKRMEDQLAGLQGKGRTNADASAEDDDRIDKKSGSQSFDIQRDTRAAAASKATTTVSKEELDRIAKKSGLQSVEYRLAAMRRVKELERAGKTAEALELLRATKF